MWKTPGKEQPVLTNYKVMQYKIDLFMTTKYLCIHKTPNSIMTKYTAVIKNRNYTEWSFQKTSTGEEVVLQEVDPISQKLLNGDIFIVDRHLQINILESPSRTQKIPAILVLSNNKTYGRHPKNNKLLYKCIPNDTHLPSFLVPYEIKHVGFSKVQQNQYAIIEFSEWTKKHPTGIVLQVLGAVDQNVHFYEYQLYCKNLQTSTPRKLNQSLNTYLKTTPESKCIAKISATVQDRTSVNVFSIDPESSVDFDDAFSIRVDETRGQTIMSIYISNVVAWIEYFDLWNSLSDRVSTIYLPDSKRPMLPAILSDHLCSLVEKQERIAFTMDIIMETNTLYILEIVFSNTKIRVFKNYCYQEETLLKSADYKLLEKTTRHISQKPGFKYMEQITDSHDVVAYWMVFMNYFCAKKLLAEKQGLFRSTITRDFVMPVVENIPENVAKFIKMTNSFTGKYTCLKENETIEHSVLQMDAYVHITSPIRRLPDILNMLKIQEILGLWTPSSQASAFYEKWILRVDDLNAQMKAIRNVQTECNILDMCTSQPELLEKNHDGYAYHKKTREGEILPFEYNVYLPELNICLKIYSGEDLPEYSFGKYKLYVFNNEEKMKKKIRIQKKDL